MRRDIDAVAFDLDGTLYPNYRLNIKLLPFILKECRLLVAFGKTREIIREEQESSPNYPLTDFYNYQAAITAKILNLAPDIVKDKIDRLMYRGWEPLFKNVEPFSYVPETLSALRAKGYKLGLLSDFPPENKLDYLGLSGCWDAVLCSESSGTIKPHPLSFLELSKSLGRPPEKILYVGNSLDYDVAGACRAGMKTAWIKNPLLPGRVKNYKPDFTFTSYRQLLDYMLN
ncbi:MAG: HAD family hydrolase [Treponema sp.]|nr:HAD family hydrolase [Treponema sp.]